MRKVVIILIAALCLAGAGVSKSHAGSYQGTGNYVGSPSPQVTAIFAAFPGGGPGLTDAIRSLLLLNPDLADDVAFVASSASAAQQQAAANGMAEAVITFMARGNSSAASAIITAATSSGNATVALIVSNAVASGNGGDHLYTQEANGNPVTTSCTTVSPTAPGGSC